MEALQVPGHGVGEGHRNPDRLPRHRSLRSALCGRGVEHAGRVNCLVPLPCPGDQPHCKNLDGLVEGALRTARLDDYKPYLIRRWNEDGSAGRTPPTGPCPTPRTSMGYGGTRRSSSAAQETARQGSSRPGRRPCRSSSSSWNCPTGRAAEADRARKLLHLVLERIKEVRLERGEDSTGLTSQPS